MDKAKIVGEYLGAHDDNPNDTFRVKIHRRYQEDLVVENINKGCIGTDTDGFRKFLMTDKTLLMEVGYDYPSGNCWNPHGFGYLVPTDEDSLIFDYFWGDLYKGDTTWSVFRGRRAK